MREPPPAQGGGSEKGEREVETLWILAACAGASGLPFLRRLLRIPEENRERTLAGVLPQLRQAIRGMLATLAPAEAMGTAAALLARRAAAPELPAPGRFRTFLRDAFCGNRWD